MLPSQLDVAARLAADFGETVFVLNHGGYHVPASPEQRELWRTGIARLARQPNVVVKVSGYDAVDPTWAMAGYVEYVLTLLEAFGVDRVLFGSNFPVDRRTISYRDLVDATLSVTQQLTADERDRLLLPQHRPGVPHRYSGAMTRRSERAQVERSEGALAPPAASDPITNQTLGVWGSR